MEAFIVTIKPVYARWKCKKKILAPKIRKNSLKINTKQLAWLASIYLVILHIPHALPKNWDARITLRSRSTRDFCLKPRFSRQLMQNNERTNERKKKERRETLRLLSNINTFRYISFGLLHLSVPHCPALYLSWLSARIRFHLQLLGYYQYKWSPQIPRNVMLYDELCLLTKWNSFVFAHWIKYIFCQHIGNLQGNSFYSHRCFSLLIVGVTVVFSCSALFFGHLANCKSGISSFLFIGRSGFYLQCLTLANGDYSTIGIA